MFSLIFLLLSNILWIFISAIVFGFAYGLAVRYGKNAGLSFKFKPDFKTIFILGFISLIGYSYFRTSSSIATAQADNFHKSFESTSPAKETPEEAREREEKYRNSTTPVAGYETTKTTTVATSFEDKFGQEPKPSPWDGSYRTVNKYLEQVAHDPDSIEIKGCTNVIRNSDKGWQVRCNYYGKNAYGGKIQNSTVFFIQHGQVTSTSM